MSTLSARPYHFDIVSAPHRFQSQHCFISLWLLCSIADCILYTLWLIEFVRSSYRLSPHQAPYHHHHCLNTERTTFCRLHSSYYHTLCHSHFVVICVVPFAVHFTPFSVGTYTVFSSHWFWSSLYVLPLCDPSSRCWYASQFHVVTVFVLCLRTTIFFTEI